MKFNKLILLSVFLLLIQFVNVQGYTSAWKRYELGLDYTNIMIITIAIVILIVIVYGGFKFFANKK